MSIERVEVKPTVSRKGIPVAPTGTGGMRKDPAYTDTRFADLISSRPEVEVMLVARILTTPRGAARLWGAEVNGKKRPNVLAAISRKLDELCRME